MTGDRLSERRLIGHILNGFVAGEGNAREQAIAVGLQSGDFQDTWCGLAFSAIASARRCDLAEVLADGIELPEINTAMDTAPTSAHFAADLVGVIARSKNRLIAGLHRQLAEAIEESRSDDATELRRQIEETADRWSLQRVRPRALLDERRFDLNNPPPPPRPIFKLGPAVIATPGNLVVMGGQAKAGKTAVEGALIAASFGCPGDTLGFMSENPAGGALVHFDTEQSRGDHFRVVETALKRAGLSVAPGWLRSYSLADVPEDRFDLLRLEIDAAKAACGSIHSVLVDGVADLVVDPNDATESFKMVANLHRLAIEHDTVIVCVLHVNPSSETWKTRGHLGSQLERKAETYLMVEKDADGITTVFSTKARHAMIPKIDGRRFRWSDEDGMHVGIACERAVRDEQTNAELRELAEAVFLERASFRHGELVDAIIKADGCKDRTAKTRITEMHRAGFIQKDGMRYQRVPYEKRGNVQI